MPHEMIERIATMIQQMHGEPGQSWEHFSDTAYAVVRDMREPTEEMMSAARGKSGANAWKVMLDVILAEHVKLDSDDSMAGPEGHRHDDDSRDSDPLFSTGP